MTRLEALTKLSLTCVSVLRSLSERTPPGMLCRQAKNTRNSPATAFDASKSHIGHGLFVYLGLAVKP